MKRDAWQKNEDRKKRAIKIHDAIVDTLRIVFQTFIAIAAIVWLICVVTHEPTTTREKFEEEQRQKRSAEAWQEIMDDFRQFIHDIAEDPVDFFALVFIPIAAVIIAVKLLNLLNEWLKDWYPDDE